VKGKTYTRGVEDNILGPKETKKGEQRKLHNEELHNLYSSLNIIINIKSRRIRWAGHVACVAQKYILGFGQKI
jgi:hypothetical protein